MDKATPRNPWQVSISPAQDSRNPSNPSGTDASAAGTATAANTATTTATTTATASTAPATPRRNPLPRMLSPQRQSQPKLPQNLVSRQAEGPPARLSFPPSPFADDDDVPPPSDAPLNFLPSPFADSDSEFSVDDTSTSGSSSGTPPPPASTSRKPVVPKLKLPTSTSDALKPSASQPAWAASPRARAPSTLSPRRHGEGQTARRPVEGLGAHRNAVPPGQSGPGGAGAAVQVHLPGPESPIAPPPAERAQWMRLLFAAQREGAKSPANPAGELRENTIKALFRGATKIEWDGSKVSGLSWISRSIQDQLLQSPIGQALNAAAQSLLAADLTGKIQLPGQDSAGDNKSTTALLRPYIAPVLQSLQAKGSTSQGAGLPAETWDIIKMMDLELVKWALENPQLSPRHINLARSNLIVNFLFTRGLGPLAKRLENPQNKRLLGLFSSALNREFNQGAGKFMKNLLVQATVALPGKEKQLFMARMSAGLQTHQGGRGTQAPETGRPPTRGRGLRPDRGSMEMWAPGTAASKAKKQALKAFETTLQSYDLAEPFLTELKERLENLPAIDSTRQKLCQATLDYIPTYIGQLKADQAELANPLLELQAALQEEVGPAETVQISAATLDELDHALSRTLTLDDIPAENDDREALLPMPEKKEKEKI